MWYNSYKREKGGRIVLIFDFKEIGNRLYFFRKGAGKTQSEVAELAGISDRTYADIERGTVNMRVETLQRICGVLNISPDALLTTDEEITVEYIADKISRIAPNKRKAALEILDAYIRNI